MIATSKDLTTPNTGVCSRCGGLFDSAGAVRTRVWLGGLLHHVTHFTHARRCPSLILPHHGVNDSTRAGTHCRSRQSLSRGETLKPARLDTYSQDSTRFAPPRCCCSLATRSNHAYVRYLHLLVESEERSIETNPGLLRRSLPTRGAASQPVPRPRSKIEDCRRCKW